MQGKKLNLTGQRFGRWTVLSEDKKDKPGKSFWLCKCDCGELSSVLGSALTSGNSKSCGCLKKEMARDSHLLPDSIGLINCLIARYKQGAEKRKLEWSLSFDEAKKLFFSSCYFCGAEPSQKYKRRKQSMLYNGIDRLDSERGYTNDNVVSCCKVCNFAKRQMSAKDFLEHIKKIYSHRFN